MYQFPILLGEATVAAHRDRISRLMHHPQKSRSQLPIAANTLDSVEQILPLLFKNRVPAVVELERFVTGPPNEGYCSTLGRRAHGVRCQKVRGLAWISIKQLLGEQAAGIVKDGNVGEGSHTTTVD